jgi:hypothetical protein
MKPKQSGHQKVNSIGRQIIQGTIGGSTIHLFKQEEKKYPPNTPPPTPRTNNAVKPPETPKK